MSSSKNNKDLQLTGSGILGGRDAGKTTLPHMKFYEELTKEQLEDILLGLAHGGHAITDPITINKDKNMKNLIEEIEKSLADAKVNLEKFENGNAAAGTRLRANAQAIRVCCVQIRDEVTRVKHARKAK